MVPQIPTFIDPVTLQDVVRAELKVDVGSNLSFKLKIENNGTRPLTAVTVRVFDNYLDDKGQQVSWNFFNYTSPPIAVGDRFNVGEKPYTETNPPLFWYANVTGEHTLEFKIFFDDQSERNNDLASVHIVVEAEVTEPSIPISTSMLGIIIAVVIAVVIVAAYVFALRRKPQVDADLYSSIYGADFEDEAMADTEAAPAAEAGPALTAEQQALYGDDYVAEGEGDYEDGEYEDGEYAEGEYAEGEYDEEYYEGDYDEATDADYEETNSKEVTKE